jgi:hypothetical protein
MTVIPATQEAEAESSRPDRTKVVKRCLKKCKVKTKCG